MINIATNDRNGKVVASLPGQDGDEIMGMRRGGMGVRPTVDDIRTTGRAAAGVTIINLNGDDRLVGVAHAVKEDDDDEEAEEADVASDGEESGEATDSAEGPAPEADGTGDEPAAE